MPARHLYLDIDGVLNTLQPNRPGTPWGRHEYPNIMVSYPPALVSALNLLIEETPDLGVFWLSSWEDEAPAFGESIGLVGAGDWPWLASAGPGRGGEWEKFVSIQEHLDETRPDISVWCDDELATEPQARGWANASGLLTISPDNVLTPEDVFAIQQYFVI